MALPKKKRIKTWCSGGGKDLGFQYDKESRETPSEKRRLKYVRCQVCDQRFQAYNRECHDVGCVHTYVPKHKAY